MDGKVFKQKKFGKNHIGRKDLVLQFNAASGSAVGNFERSNNLDYYTTSVYFHSKTMF
jgi:hypothetical protein